jgi:hypothetical protein
MSFVSLHHNYVLTAVAGWGVKNITVKMYSPQLRT